MKLKPINWNQNQMLQLNPNFATKPNICNWNRTFATSYLQLLYFIFSVLRKLNNFVKTAPIWMIPCPIILLNNLKSSRGFVFQKSYLFQKFHTIFKLKIFPSRKKSKLRQNFSDFDDFSWEYSRGTIWSLYVFVDLQNFTIFIYFASKFNSPTSNDKISTNFLEIPPISTVFLENSYVELFHVFVNT